MATFAIYKYLLKNNLGNLFTKDDPSLKTAQARLGEAMKQPFSLKKIMQDGQSEPYSMTILRNDQSVVIMRLSNPKSKQLVNVYQEDYGVTTFPTCHVIIDNREGVGQIVIEQCSESFGKHTDKVRDLLEKWLKNALEDYKLDIEIHAKVRTGAFWDVVNENIRLNDPVKSVKFTFPNPKAKTPVASPSVELTESLTKLTQMGKTMNALSGVLTYVAEKDASLNLDQTQEDMANMVDLCCENGYDLQVTFRKYGLFRCGDEGRLIQEMPPLVLEHYVKGEPEIGENGTQEYALINWLNDVIQFTNKYGHDKSPKRRRKRNSKN